MGEEITQLPLKYDYFKKDALVFLDLKSREITLKNKARTRQIKVSYEGFDYTLIWTKIDANYVCIEPWCGLPDFEGSSYDITQKTGINKIDKDGEFKRVHTITFEK